MKNIIAASILLSLFIVMVFGHKYVMYWAQTYEGSHTAQVVFWSSMVVGVIGLLCWRDNLKQKEKQSEQHKQAVAEFVDNHKAIKLFEEAQATREKLRQIIHDEVYGDKPYTKPEMRENAESFLTQDQKALLHMRTKNPHFIDTKA